MWESGDRVKASEDIALVGCCVSEGTEGTVLDVNNGLVLVSWDSGSIFAVYSEKLNPVWL